MKHIPVLCRDHSGVPKKQQDHRHEFWWEAPSKQVRDHHVKGSSRITATTLGSTPKDPKKLQIRSNQT